MAIIKILARTGVLFVCSIIQMINVLIEGITKLLIKIGEYLAILDDKMMKPVVKKAKNTEEKPT